MRSPQFMLFISLLEVLRGQHLVYDSSFTCYIHDENDMIEAIKRARKDDTFKVMVKGNKITVKQVWE